MGKQRSGGSGDKVYDIVVLGATGFTGQLVCEYIAQHSPQGLIWAIAGRNAQKLQAVLDSIGREIDYLVVDVEKQDDVDKMAASTKVILNTAGPFSKYATPVVDACVRFHTHYCDITGEYHWVRKIIDSYHERAAQGGTLIVPMCGFDSIPSDIGTFIVVDYIKKKYNASTKSVRGFIRKTSGGISGGTFHTLLHTLDTLDAKSAKSGQGPFVLVTNGNLPSGPKSEHIDSFLPAKHPELRGNWSAFFPLCTGNMRLVRRSASILGYGPSFTYKEHWDVKYFLVSLFVTVGLVIFFVLVLFPPTRALLRRFGPAAGTGPSKKSRENGFINLEFYGVPENLPGVQVRGKLKGAGDPGYKFTSLLVSEAAFALALDKNLPYSKAQPGGVLSPAAAFGTSLVERLQNAGVELTVETIQA